MENPLAQVVTEALGVISLDLIHQRTSFFAVRSLPITITSPSHSVNLITFAV